MAMFVHGDSIRSTVALLFAAAALIPGSVTPSMATCELHLTVPIFDGQTWTGGCNAQIKGGVSYHDLFCFRGVGGVERLWLDNLRISESDAPRSSRGAALELRAANDALSFRAFKNRNMQSALEKKID